jgi:hypothetical protein
MIGSTRGVGNPASADDGKPELFLSRSPIST